VEKLKIGDTPGCLKLFWKEKGITASYGGVLCFRMGNELLRSDRASWTKEGPNRWSGRWPNIPGFITWEASAVGEHVNWKVSFNIEIPMRCDRLELVLPLATQYHAWKIAGLENPSELIDPGILGEKYNLDFLALRTSGFFTGTSTNGCRYLALVSQADASGGKFLLRMAARRV
jgi:hypothetical protein